MKLSTRRRWLVAALALASVACGTGRGAVRPQREPFERQCHPPPPGSPHPPPRAEEVVDPARAERLGLSGAARQIAEVIGVMPLLVELPDLEAAANASERGAALELVNRRQRIAQRIALAQLEANAVIAEVECELERTERTASNLDARRSRRTTELTTMAVVSGAVAALVSGLLTAMDERGQGDAVSLAGGIVQIGFGTAAVLRTWRTGFNHPRNLLRELWVGPEISEFFPWTVWRFLTRPGLDEPNGPSLRKVMIDHWREVGQLGRPQTAREDRRIELFFGAGGSYTVEELRARAAMLEVVSSDVQLMHQDLMVLLRELLEREHGVATEG